MGAMLFARNPKQQHRAHGALLQRGSDGGRGLEPALDAGAVAGLQQFRRAGLKVRQVAVADRLAQFQPHRYSRTRDQFDAFAAVLSEADALVLSEVYPAGEQPIAGADAKSLARAIRARGRNEPVVVSQVADLVDVLPDVLQDGDLLLMMGAGDIGHMSQHIAAHGFSGKASA